jgi:hypothetical protein
MPYQHLKDGLYLIKTRCREKGVDHYGILDVGNRLGLPGVNGIRPVIVHQTPPRIRFDWLEGKWNVLGKIADEKMARERVRIALQDPKYALFGNNCEDVARFIATGRKESTQVAVGLLATGTAVILAAIAIK